MKETTILGDSFSLRQNQEINIKLRKEVPVKKIKINASMYNSCHNQYKQLDNACMVGQGRGFDAFNIGITFDPSYGALHLFCFV